MLFRKNKLTKDCINELLDYLIINQQGMQAYVCWQERSIELPFMPMASLPQEPLLTGSMLEESESVSKKRERTLEELMDLAVTETFSQMLLRLIDEKGRRDVDVYKGANIDRKHFSKIRSKKEYAPGKNTVLALAVSLKLSLDECMDLLSKAGYTFSDCNRQDLIVKFFIEKGEHDLFLINEALDHFGEGTLGV